VPASGRIHNPREKTLAAPSFDADALIEMFQNAGSRQGAQLKKAVTDTTLAALQGRELTLKNIRGVLKQVAEAAGAGVAKNAVAGVDPEALLDKAVAGMDEALLKAVEAQRTALATLAAQGADLRDKHLGKALADLEKMEDGIFCSTGAQASAAGPAAPPQALRRRPWPSSSRPWPPRCRRRCAARARRR
jgi:hypothetical protein